MPRSCYNGKTRQSGPRPRPHRESRALRRIHVNYAHRKFRPAQFRCSWTALAAGRFDEVRSYGRGDLDPEFVARHRDILDAPRGAGYWLWKPWVIADALRHAAEGDIVVYTDASMVWLQPPDPLIAHLIDNTPGITGIRVSDVLDRRLHRAWTKRDAFVLMGCDVPACWDAPQIEAGTVACVNNAFARAFVDEWLHYAGDPRVITDDPNVMGLPNLPEFVDHRHDQSVFSLLCWKKGLVPAARAGLHGEIFRLTRKGHHRPWHWLRPRPTPARLVRWLRPFPRGRWRKPTRDENGE